MDKAEVFRVLAGKRKGELLRLLGHAFDALSVRDRRYLFGDAVRKAGLGKVGGQKLLKEVEKFHKDSLNKGYYAPFAVNSKNFSHVPEETEFWFERLADLLKKSSLLTKQGEHQQAVACFSLLYELVLAIDEGEEIVFADELGSWMMPLDEKKVLPDYLKSLAATATPEVFAEAVCPLVRRDSYSSFCNKVHALANRFASKEQKACLKSEISRQGIRLSPRRRG